MKLSSNFSAQVYMHKLYDDMKYTGQILRSVSPLLRNELLDGMYDYHSSTRIGQFMVHCIMHKKTSLKQHLVM